MSVEIVFSLAGERMWARLREWRGQKRRDGKTPGRNGDTGELETGRVMNEGAAAATLTKNDDGYYQRGGSTVSGGLQTVSRFGYQWQWRGGAGDD